MDVTWYVVLSAVLFAIGAGGVLIRRSPLVILLCLELMQIGRASCRERVYVLV